MILVQLIVMVMADESHSTHDRAFGYNGVQSPTDLCFSPIWEARFGLFDCKFKEESGYLLWTTQM